MPIINSIGSLSIEDGGDYVGPSESISAYKFVVDTKNVTTTDKTLYLLINIKNTGNVTVNWGDGSSLGTVGQTSATEFKVSHTYTTQGEYTVSVTSTTGYMFCTAGCGTTNRQLSTMSPVSGVVETDGITEYAVTRVVSWGGYKFHSMKSMFAGNTNLISIPAQAPNLSECTSLAYTFINCHNFNQSLNHWDITRITDVRYMLSNLLYFDQPLNNWNTENITNMQGMFANTPLFNQPLNRWNTSNVANMSYMFSCTNSGSIIPLFNQNISMWDTERVTNMDNMFDGQQTFNQDLSIWCVINIKTKPPLFDNNTPSWALPKPEWGTCAGLYLTNVASSIVLSVGVQSNPSVFQVWGGGGGYVYSVAPPLPAGLSFSYATVAGKPTVSQIPTLHTFYVKAANGKQLKAVVSIEVKQAMVITALVSPLNLILNKAITPVTTVSASNNIGQITYSINPTLPSGLTFNSSSSIISGTPTSISANTTYTVTGTTFGGQRATTTFNLSVGYPPIIITTNALTFNMKIGANTTIFPVSASGGSGTLIYSINPQLPSGLTLNVSTGSIAGTPTVGTPAIGSIFVITATDANSGLTKVSEAFSLIIPELQVTASQNNFTFIRGSQVSTQPCVNATGGSGKYTYSISPALPSGLTFNTSTAVIFGKPTVVSPITIYTVSVSDGYSSSSVSFNIHTYVVPFAATAINSYLEYDIGTSYPMTLSLNTTGGTGSYAYSINPSLPTVLSMSSTTGAIGGVPNVASTTDGDIFNITVTDGYDSKTVPVTIFVNGSGTLVNLIATPENTTFEYRGLNVGSTVRISGDGKYLLVSSFSGEYSPISSPSVIYTNRGMVFFYYFDGSTWVQQAQFSSSNLPLYGQDTDINYSGDVAVVGANNGLFVTNQKVNPPSVRTFGMFFIYKRADTTWKLHQSITAPVFVYQETGAWAENYRLDAKIDNSGQYIIVGISAHTKENNNKQYIKRIGKVCIYKKLDTGLWDLKQEISPSDLIAEDRFGEDITVSRDGTIFTSLTSYKGGQNSLYIFSLANDTWTQKQKLTPGVIPNTICNFANICIKSDNTKIAALIKDAENSTGWLFATRIVFYDLIDDTYVLNDTEIVPKYNGINLFSSNTSMSVDSTFTNIIIKIDGITQIYNYNNSIWNKVKEYNISSDVNVSADINDEGTIAVFGTPGSKSSNGSTKITKRSGVTKWSK